MKKIYQFLSLCCIIAVMTCFTMSKGYAQCNPFEITSTTPFTEDFSGYQGVSSMDVQGVLPTCWGKIYTGTAANYDPKVYNGTSAVTSGDNCIAISVGQQFSLTSFSYIDAGTSNYVILPTFANTVDLLQLIFTSKMNSDSTGILEVGYFSDTAEIIDSIDVSTFVVLATVASTTTATNQTITFGEIAGTENLSKNIVFRWSANGGGLGSLLSMATCCIDNISVRIAPTCIEPSDVTVSAVTDVSAVIGWTAGSADQSLWEISCNGNIISNVTTNPYTLTGLTSSTEYEVSVRAVCTGETSYWATPSVSFTTTCDVITITDNAPYTEDFSAYQALDSLTATGVMPSCWEKIYTGRASDGFDPKVYNGTDAVVSGDNCLAITSGEFSISYGGFGYTLYSAGAQNLAILPPMSNALDNLQLFFTSKMSSDTTGMLEIGYFTGVATVDNFIGIATVTNTTVATNQLYTLSDFPQLQGVSNVRLAFRWIDNNTMGRSSCYIDDLTVRIARDCAEPSDITVSNISDVSAVISWTAAPGQNLWEISCNDSIISNVTTNPYTLTGLTASTEYVINVRAVCANESSYWAAQPATFTTACPAITVTDENPYTEGFEGADLDCWYPEVMEGEDNWEHSFYASHTGSKGVSYSSSVFGDLTNMTDLSAIISMMSSMTNFGNGAARLTSPIFDLTGVTGQVKISFYRKQSTMMIPQTLYVYYRTSPTSQWISLEAYNTATDWTGESVILPNPSATYQISFASFCDIQSMGNIDPTAFMSQTASTDFASTIYLDDIRIGYAIVCDDPTNLSFSNVNETSVTATWSGSADNWTLEYGEAGFAQGSGTTVTAQNSTYTFTGLTPGTSYDVYVRANCPEDNFSGWVRGSVTTAGGSAVSENGSVSLTIFPNPTNGTVRCTLNGNTTQTRLQVLDVYGKLMMEKEVSGQTTELDFSDKAAGVYFLRVIDGNSIVTTQKVVRR